MSLDLQQYPILVVDDEQDNLDAFRFNFRRSFDILTATSGPEALELLADHDVAVIVTDQRMPRMTGLELLREAQGVRPDAVGIILTAFTDVDVLIESINQGTIYRYITKPWEAKEVRGVLTHAIERFHLKRENSRLVEQLQQYTGYLNREIHGAFDFGNIIGGSEALKEVLERVEQVAPTASSVLLRGETGTGKELVAHAVHINSTREDKPFVRVNCAALAPGILESELFGHEKGAFTGAIARRAGRFELADSGTLFLDEVGDLPMEVQIKLLRTLQEREFERVGGHETIKVDVRVISATNRDLESMIEEGTFREDLYYRLNVFPINLPPLRERTGDLPLLVDHFIAKFSRNSARQVLGCSEAALAKLRAYSWPGNVRELENIIERAMILAKGDHIDGGDLDFGRRAQQTGSTPTLSPADAAPRTVIDDDQSKPLAERLLDKEKTEIVAAVEKSNSNIAGAARMLGINRSTLYYRMRKHGLDHLLPTKVGVGGGDDPEPETGAEAGVQLMRILVIADPLSRFDLAGDTTYALMLEAARRDHEIFTCELPHLGLEHEDAVAQAAPTEVLAGNTPAEAFTTGERVTMPLELFDIVLMRKDPPVDMDYLHATWILDRARGKTILVNDPRGLRELNEHLSILEFPDLIPPTIVTRSQARLRAFLEEQGGAVVVKPVEGYGGLGVFLVRHGDPNLSSIFETATGAGTSWTMAQRYLPEASRGDKRILLVDGEPIGAVLRVPAADEARGNLHVGGRAVRSELDAEDRAIIRAVAPMLERFGQIFVGLDVIGGRLTEINITSPTGIRHIEALEKRNVAAQVIDRLEQRARG